MLAENGLRKVSPYYHASRVFCKQRWFARSVLDVIVSEFSAFPEHYHKSAVNAGLVSVVTQSGREISGPDVAEHVISNGDLLKYTSHYHEPPVIDFGDSIDLVHNGDDVVVVNKPAGIPTHPTGKYRLNSLTEVLAAQLGAPVYPAHRLDRLTSGIVLLGKTTEATSRIRLDLLNNNVQKHYYARVVGRVTGDVEVDLPLFDIDAKRSYESFREISKSASHAKTQVKLLAYDESSNTSVVICSPVTGRTHQIRKHLCSIGHPIVNDELYRRPPFARLFSLLEKENRGQWDDSLESQLRETFDEIKMANASATAEKATQGTCPVCYTPLYKDPQIEELQIYLHAFKYACDGKWSYETAAPTWVSNPVPTAETLEGGSFSATAH